MNKALLGFAFGVTVGALVTVAIVEEKYRKIAEEEIEAVRNYYKNKDKSFEELEIEHNREKMFKEAEDVESMEFSELPNRSERVVVKDAKHEIPKETYDKIVSDLGYTEQQMDDLLADPDVIVQQTEDGEYEIIVGAKKNEPYTITPDEFGELDGYDCEYLTYYSDCVLTNEDDEVIEEPYSIIGDALNCFGEYVDDSVFVRNDRDKCDYEIVKYNKPFGEINGSELDD